MKWLTLELCFAKKLVPLQWHRHPLTVDEQRPLGCDLLKN